MIYKLNRHLCAVEILTTGYCPFNCKYCYIPKSDKMHNIHKDIIKSLESGKYIEYLKATYGVDLEYLSFWGTEPTLTLKYLINLLPVIKKEFPKLKRILFSTSMMNTPGEIFNFAKALINNDFNIMFGVQISIDGPSWVTDENRIKGSGEAIPKNFLKLVKDLNRINTKRVKIWFHWKSTHNIENMKMFLENPSRIHEYVGYFASIEDKFNKINKNKNITLTKASPATLAVPGKYTSADGKIFTKYIKLLHDNNYYTAYYIRLKRVFDFWNDLRNSSQFTCSGGDSNLGLASNNKYHICHRTFYLDNEDYIQSILDTDIENWDISLFERGTIDFIKKYYIVESKDMSRFLYVMRGFHDFWRLRICNIISLLNELAISGQIDEEYYNNKTLALLFAIFSCTCLSCPMENLLNTGSMSITFISLLRLFCNGAFKEILKEITSDGNFPRAK